MEKVNKMPNINIADGDCDDHVDWEDFVIIQGNIIALLTFL